MLYITSSEFICFITESLYSLIQHLLIFARTYNGEKTVSPISGSGKTGHIHPKE